MIKHKYFIENGLTGTALLARLEELEGGKWHYETRDIVFESIDRYTLIYTLPISEWQAKKREEEQAVIDELFELACKQCQSPKKRQPFSCLAPHTCEYARRFVEKHK